MALYDETSCSAVLCTHPGCWKSDLRYERGLPNPNVFSSPEPKDEDEGLPTQKIVNLMANYEDQSSGQFSSKPQYKSRRSYSLPSLGRSGTRDTSSFPTTLVPQVTPASPALRSYKTFDTNSTATKKDVSKRLHKVEVQELFDLDDLQRNWQDTFMAKKYYVWVPSGKTQKSHVTPLQTIPINRLTQGPRPLSPKDMTEKMVPQDVQTQREDTVVHDDVWPVLKEKHKQRSTGRKSPSGGRPYKHRKPKDTKIDEDLMSELSEIPAHILSQVFKYIDPSLLTSKAKVLEALEKVPALERDSTALSLVSSLQQKKMNILDGKERMTKQPEIINAKQVFLLDNDFNFMDKLSTANDPEDLADMSDLSSLSNSPREFPSKKPLPPILGNAESEATSSRSKIPNISLGLPVIPAGTRLTKTFTYTRDAKYDFMLDKIPTPPVSEKSRSVTPQSPDMEPGSTIHVTVPSVQTEVDDMVSPTGVEMIRDKHSQKQEYSSPSLHGVSPTYTSHSQGNSAGLSPGRQLTRDSTLLRDTGLSLSSTKSGLYRDETVSSVPMPRPPVNTPSVVVPHHATISPERTGTLDTIHEAGNIDGQKEVRRQYSNLSNSSNRPRGGRSVRFAPDAHNSATNQRDQDAAFVVVPTTIPLYGSPAKKHGDVTPGISPEPWPLVEEEEYTVPPSPPPPPPTAPASEAKPAVSRESSYHSELARKIMIEGSVEDSPAPPPPSPEPRDVTRAAGIIAKDAIPMSVLEEVVESESELTITAPPPSNLDDSSRINTPADMASRSRPNSKSDPHKPGDGLLNVDSLARSRPTSKGESFTQSVIEEEPSDWAVLSALGEQQEKENADFVSSGTQEAVRMSKETEMESARSAEIDYSTLSKPSVEDAKYLSLSFSNVTDSFNSEYTLRESADDVLNMVIESNTNDIDKDIIDKGNSLDNQITEDGGDNEAFKEELREEFQKLTDEIPDQ